MEENEEKDNGTAVKIVEVINITLKKWPMILLSVAICVSLAVLYVLRTEPTYTRDAEIVLRNDRQGSSMGVLSDFADMGLIKTNTVLVDELNKFQSPDLMQEVVRRLTLDISYRTPGTFHDNILYGSQLPVKVTFPNLDETKSASFDLDISKSGKVTISNLRRDKESYEDFKVTGKQLGQTIGTPAGPIVVNKTTFFKPGTEYKIKVTKKSVQAAAESFLAKVTIANKDKDGNTISITAQDQSTQRAEDLINNIIAVYNERWIENRNKISVATSRFINERLQMIEGELGNVDQDISSYQSEHLIPDVQQAAQLYMTENQSAQKEIMAINNQLQMARYVHKYIIDDTNSEQLLPANSGIGSAAIEHQISDYNTAMLERDQLAANSSRTHPRVMDLDAKLGSMRNAILQAVDTQIRTLENQLSNLQTSRSQTTAQIAANPTPAKYLLSVERQQKVKEALYVYLLQKREENELAQAYTANNTEIVKSPIGTLAPTSPRKFRILLCAFVLGLLIPFGITYLQELTNTKLRGRGDLDELGVPLAGEIPNSKKNIKDQETDAVVVQQGKRNIVNEAFRLLRTNVGFMSAADKDCSVIMLTSFNPGSGKTFITVNLGVSMAIKGKKTLVIDCDLRKAATSEFVHNPHHGLTDYLVGKTDDPNAIMVCDTIVDNLCVMPVGVIPPNPTELLESNRFGELIAKLRREFDYILIDCPPVEMMADAAIIEGSCDRTLFVVRAGKLERRMLPELKKMYDEKRYKNLSIVLNGTIPEGARYRYGYGYNYSYGNYNVDE